MAPRASVLVVALITVAAAGWLGATAARGQGPPSLASTAPPRTDPVPPGRRIEVADGDTVVINGEDRVRIVRHREGIVRLIVDVKRGVAMLIADYPPRGSVTPDGRADESFRFASLQGEWNFESRWEGPAVVEEMTGPVLRVTGVERPGPMTIISVAGAYGVIQFLPQPVAGELEDAGAATVLRYSGAARNQFEGLTLDEAESRLTSMIQVPGRGGPIGPSPAGGRQQVEAGATSSESSSITPRAGVSHPVEGGPVRVGGDIAPPRRTHHVRPEYPEAAREAGVTGVVILEVTIARDGSVSDARIVRSIPPLDAAALEAVRQWKFTPTVVNGQPVKVKMVTTVNFTLP